ncbi:saur-like auxin-responsive protein family [Citrus sinensis]|uniref:Saur-like auxin-responsive protein family n=1 Tax=Citrus sinensis TaxID=2711 RepID=A0ACB8IIK4_CITSI|nr:saur-like auxin-responsive protein family [Citrus sinensis]
MAIRFPSALNAKHILRQSKLLANQAAAAASVSADVPKGYLARLIIPVSFLNQPSFQELLTKAGEDFGYNHPMGGLTIPCRKDAFINLTSRLNWS